MTDLERDLDVESDCEPIEPVVPVTTPAKVSAIPIPSLGKVEAKRPQPPRPPTPAKSSWGWDKMALEIAGPRPPHRAPPPVVEPVLASWGKSGPVSPTLSQRKSHTPLVSIYEFRYSVVYSCSHYSPRRRS